MCETCGLTWADFMEGWRAGLYADPVLCAAAAGVVLGFLGVYIVLRRMVFVSAAVTQSAGLGVALVLWLAIQLDVAIEPSWGAVGLSLATAGFLTMDPARLGLTREMLLGVVFALTGGLAVLLGSRIAQEAADIQAILFGTAVLVSPEDLMRVLVVGGAVLVLHLWWFRGVTFASFDPIAARVQGLPVRLLDAALLLSIGVMVGVAARALGAMPVFALSTLPAVAALLVARGPLLVTYLLAAVLGAAAGVVGYIVAFFWELPVGSSQTVTAVALVPIALIVRGITSFVGRLR